MKNIIQLVTATGLKNLSPKLFEAFINIDKTLDELKAQIDAIKNQDTLYCRAFSDANQTITTGGGGAAVIFNTNVDQNSNFHDTVNNNTFFYISQPGWYDIGAIVRWALNVVGQRVLRIRLIRNAATTTIGIDIRPGNANIAPLNVTVTGHYLFPRDIVFAEVFQDSGGNLDVVTTANYSPLFWLQRNVRG